MNQEKIATITVVSAPVSLSLQQVCQPGQSPLWGIWLRLYHSPSGVVGLMLVLLHIGLALAAPSIVPYDPVVLEPAAIRAAPSRAHLFGTDKLGRDVLTRTLLGGRVALLVTSVGTGLAITWGGLLGITLAYLGGIIDELVMRFVDAVLALPRLLILLVMASLFGTGAVS